MQRNIMLKNNNTNAKIVSIFALDETHFDVVMGLI